jgi:hypothetical protein
VRYAVRHAYLRHKEPYGYGQKKHNAAHHVRHAEVRLCAGDHAGDDQAARKGVDQQTDHLGPVSGCPRLAHHHSRKQHCGTGTNAGGNAQQHEHGQRLHEGRTKDAKRARERTKEERTLATNTVGQRPHAYGPDGPAKQEGPTGPGSYTGDVRTVGRPHDVCHDVRQVGTEERPGKAGTDC